LAQERAELRTILRIVVIFHIRADSTQPLAIIPRDKENPAKKTNPGRGEGPLAGIGRMKLLASLLAELNPM
jgi:hypothetical protein